MKKSINITVSFLFIFLGFASDYNFAQKINLWPEIEPFHTEYLKVSEIHEIYYELCGNPKGKPVFVLHGGPGGSCSPYMRQFFNPEKFHVILHDQRGAGKSKPYA
jgi:proline iminopeptidase